MPPLQSSSAPLVRSEAIAKKQDIELLAGSAPSAWNTAQLQPAQCPDAGVHSVRHTPAKGAVQHKLTGQQLPSPMSLRFLLSGALNDIDTSSGCTTRAL